MLIFMQVSKLKIILEKTNWLLSHQFTVIRFSNEQIFNDIESVLQTIAQALIP
jgi:very-short-patch-repair endonuclease